MLSKVIIAQSGKVKSGISHLKQAQDFEAKLNALGDSINSLNSKLTGVAALSWVVSKQTKPNEDVIVAEEPVELLSIRFVAIVMP